MEIRDAVPGDEAQIATVLRRSIRALCVDDHNNDDAILNLWLRNKTAANVLSWIQTQTVLVASERNVIVGVAAASEAGEVLSNYVDPSARFTGVSTALLETLEVRLAGTGIGVVHLVSTRTALRFYNDRGYSDSGSPEEWAGLTGFPMKERFTPQLA